MEPENQESITVHDFELKSDTDSDGASESKDFSTQGMVKLEESDGNEKIYSLIRRNLPLGMGSLGKEINVVAIHQKTYSSAKWEAKLKAFENFSQVVAAVRGGNANLKNVWYGGSRSEICEVVDIGFRKCDGYLQGVGLSLSPINYPLHSVIRATEDNEGLRHIVMCRVILGKTEEISGVWQQLKGGGSMYFDSGADNPLAPTKYIVWNADMITLTLPSFIVTFTAPSYLGRNWTPPKRPNSA